MLTRAHLERARLDRLTSAQKVFFVARVARRMETKNRKGKKNKKTTLRFATEKRSLTSAIRTFRVPHDDVPVVRAGGHPEVAGGVVSARARLERRAPDRAAVPPLLFRDDSRAAPVVAVGILLPDANVVVVGHRHQHVLGWVPFDLLHVLRVPVQHRDALEVEPGLAFPDPHRLVASARRQQRPARRKRARLDLVLVPLHDGDALPVTAALGPHRRGRVERSRRQHAA